jgi:hypothetical protein
MTTRGTVLSIRQQGPLPAYLGGACREYIVLCGHTRMARVSTFGAGHGRLKRVGSCIIGELGICPSMCPREPLGILFNKRNRFQGTRYRRRIRRLRVLSLRPLDLRNHGTVGKRLANAWNAFSIGINHRGIRPDGLYSVIGGAHGDILPCLVSSKLGKPEPIRHVRVNLFCAAGAMPPRTVSDTAAITIAEILLFISLLPELGVCPISREANTLTRQTLFRGSADILPRSKHCSLHSFVHAHKGLGTLIELEFMWVGRRPDMSEPVEAGMSSVAMVYRLYSPQV